jgi:hypothetical protein
MGVVPGRFTRLIDNKSDQIFMSDTPSEIAGHMKFLEVAHGRVLITGLGLGMVVSAHLKADIRNSAVVVEKSPDVIRLVGSQLVERWPRRLRIVEADAFEWPCDTFFEYAWHDIWPDIRPDNVVEMDRLREKYAYWVNEEQMCWAENRCRAMQAQYEALIQEVKDRGKWDDYLEYCKERGIEP